jgi:hypothetical protein
MNRFKLKEFNGERLIYLYQPEGRGEWGEVAYSFTEGMARLIRQAEENSIYYSNKALTKVEECAKGKALPIDFIQAWV